MTRLLIASLLLALTVPTFAQTPATEEFMFAPTRLTAGRHESPTLTITGLKDLHFRVDARDADWNDPELRLDAEIVHSLDGGVTWKYIGGVGLKGGDRDLRLGTLPRFGIPRGSLTVDPETGLLRGMVKAFYVLNKPVRIGLVSRQLSQ